MAAVVAAGAVGLAPAGAGAGLDDTASPTCPASTGLPQVTNRVIGFTGVLTCYRPGAPRFGANVAPPNVVERLANPSLGDPCRNIYYYPVSFTEDTNGGANAVFAFAGRATAGTFELSADDAARIGTFDAMVSDVQLGSYEPSNPADPNSPLTCVLNPTYHFICPATGALDQFCYTWVFHAISPASSPPPPWGPYFAQAIGSIAGEAGTIHSSPSQTGVVNTPVCFWVDGMGIPVERDLTLILPGAADASGRQVFYTFLARIRFDRVDWSFDDPYGDSLDAPAQACGSHPQLVAHSYRQISDDRNPDHRYHVTAVERYTITVDVFWIDGTGPHHQVVDPGVSSPAISPAVYSQYVGQVEGIPIGSP